MKKSYLVLLFCLMILQACGGGGSADGDSDPNGGNQQNLSLNGIGNKSVLGGETLNFTLSASNPNGGTLTYMADGTSNVTNPLTLTNRVSFSESSGVFNWDTLASDTGSYNITFSVANNSESDSETISIMVQDTIAYGEGLYITHCQNCHGPNGTGGSTFGVQGTSPYYVRDALGLEDTTARRGMTNIASQLANPTRDANAIGYFLCDAAGININDPQVCPVDQP
jgi:hypothetical protein